MTSSNTIMILSYKLFYTLKTERDRKTLVQEYSFPSYNCWAELTLLPTIQGWAALYLFGKEQSCPEGNIVYIVGHRLRV